MSVRKWDGRHPGVVIGAGGLIPERPGCFVDVTRSRLGFEIHRR